MIKVLYDLEIRVPHLSHHRTEFCESKDKTF